MNRKKAAVVISIVLIVGIVGAIGFGIAGVSAQEEENETAQDKAPMYEDAEDPDTDSWLQGIQPDLEGVVMLVSRVGTFVVGGGATGVSGSLLTGVLVMGLGLGSVSRAGVGSIAGGTLAVAGVFAGVATGIAPVWTSGVVMFGIGLVLASVFRRILN